MVLGDTGLASLTVVGISVAVAAADRIPNIGTRVRNRDTDPLVVRDVAGAVWELAKLVCFRAGDSGEAAADRGSSARPMVIFGYACLYAFTIIVIGLAIAPAHRIKNGRAASRSRYRHADTLEIRYVTGSRRKVTQLAWATGNPGNTAADRRSPAGPIVIFGCSGLYAFAIIVIGLAVAPADRVEDTGANLRYRHTDTLVIRHVAGAGRKVAQFVRLAGYTCKAAANRVLRPGGLSGNTKTKKNGKKDQATRFIHFDTLTKV